MSQEHATSHPPPKANPSTIAMVGLVNPQSASTALSVNLIFVATLSIPTNSEMSAPATNAFGFGRFPSSAGNGLAPAIMTHLIDLSFSTQAQNFFNESMTSAFKAFNLFGRFIYRFCMYPSIESSFNGIFLPSELMYLGRP